MTINDETLPAFAPLPPAVREVWKRIEQPSDEEFAACLAGAIGSPRMRTAAGLRDTTREGESRTPLREGYDGRT